MNKTPYQRVKEWRLKHKNRVKAQRAVFICIRNGTLKRRPCIICKNLLSEAHHPNYRKPLEVIWLCKKHHIEADKNRKKKNKSGKLF